MFGMSGKEGKQQKQPPAFSTVKKKGKESKE